MNSCTRTSPWLLVGALATTFLLSAGALLAMNLGLTYPCPFKFLFQVPCPTCGTTRSLAALASLDFAQSLRWNPFILIGGTGALAALLLRGRFRSVDRAAWPLFVGGFLLNWFYLILFLPR